MQTFPAHNYHYKLSEKKQADYFQISFCNLLVVLPILIILISLER